MATCSDCGDRRGRHEHPEYPGDLLCGECRICLLEAALEQAEDDLQQAQEALAFARSRRRGQRADKNSS